ncbi:MAG TPA: nucleotide exchange factor GrpE, partial [Limnochordia bacterium]|nr:nucleotide exchange factor GrpE [Limnochordia bacterium]
MSEATKSGPEAQAAEPVAAHAAAGQASEVSAEETGAGEAQHAEAALRAELESALAQAREREVQYVRLRADFDNFRRRKEQEAAELKQRAAEGLFADLLPVADNLERAIAASSQAADDEGRDGLRKGVEMVLGQLRAA